MGTHTTFSGGPSNGGTDEIWPPWPGIPGDVLVKLITLSELGQWSGERERGTHSSRGLVHLQYIARNTVTTQTR